MSWRSPRSVVAEEPLREHRWATLALAQYRCGRQADALRSLRRARQTLVEELGIEPGTEIVALERAILDQDDDARSRRRNPRRSPNTARTRVWHRMTSTTPRPSSGGPTTWPSASSDCGPTRCWSSPVRRAAASRRSPGPVWCRRWRVPASQSPCSCQGTMRTAAMTQALASCDGAPVLVVDQFEEVFILADEVLRSGAVVLRPTRRLRSRRRSGGADRTRRSRRRPRGSTSSSPGWPSAACISSRHLSGERLREAIEGPAAQAGLRIEPGLVDLLVRDCEGEPGALPLLSHALAETWQRRDGRVLTVEGYRATGEIRGAVARSADRLYESLPVDQRAKLRSLLLRLVSSSADGEPVRSRVSTRTLGGDVERERVLGLLVRARLVTAEEDSVELAHEALARAWPRLRSWLDEDAAGQRILRHLSAASEGWESLGRPATELYRGARLEATLEWRSAAAPDLTELEREFLDASIAEASAARERHADEQRAHARQRRRLRRALAAVAVMVVVATAGVVTAYRQRETSEQERREAAAGTLVSRSEVLRSGQADVAAPPRCRGPSSSPRARPPSRRCSACSRVGRCRHGRGRPR